MRTSMWRRGAVSLISVAVVVGAAGCKSDGDTKAGGAAKPAKAATVSTPVQALSAAVKKLSSVKSAKFDMTTSVPVPKGTAGADADGTKTVKTSGRIGWNPTAAEMKMDTASLGLGDPGQGEPISVLLADGVVYLDMGADAAKDMDGKRWMKIDIAALAEQQGGAGAGSAIGDSLRSSNQDPTQQLKLLLDSPGVKRVGAEKVGGVQTQHYKGALSLDQLVDASASAERLTAAKRAQLSDTLRKSGLTSESFDIWVNDSSYPVQVNVSEVLKTGVVRTSLHYSDYSATASVAKAPAAGETFSLQDMMKAAQGSADGGNAA
jgi:hypothetical protein